MSEYLRGMDISQYTEGQVTAICEYFKNQGTPLSVAQVELTSGTTSMLTSYINDLGYRVYPEIIKTIADIKENNLNLGYYAYLYPYNGEPGWATVEEQGQAFVEAYRQVQNELGITPDCKIMIDIESGAFSPKTSGVTATPSLIKNMVDIFTETINQELGPQEYVVYSSASFISGQFGEIDTNKYGVIVSDVSGKLFDMYQITYPTESYTPIAYWKYPNNWGNNWTGVQFNYGGAQDYDIYTNDILISNKAKQTQPILFKDGDYVKLKPNTSLFAPNKIPSTDKGPQYIVCDVNGNDYKLHPINQWVTDNELKLIKSYSPENNTPQSNNLSKGWDGLDLLTKAALYIGSNEGFGQNDDGYPWDGNTIGYSTSNYQQYSNGPLNIPISQEEGIELVINYLKANINTWNNDIINGGLNLNELSDNQLIALYDFGYQTGGGDHLLLELCQCIATRSAAYNPTFGSFLLHANDGVRARRHREWQTYFSGKIHFGGAVNQLPSQYINIIDNL